MADGSVVVNEIYFKYNFSPFPKAVQCCLSQKVTYTPIVFDMSDDLVETVKELEKSENVIRPTPLATCHTPFDVFKPNRGHQSCSTRKAIKSPNIYKFNPIRSSEAMTELSKKRWVNHICTLMVF